MRRFGKNVKLRKWEEALPRRVGKSVEIVQSNDRGRLCDGFHPKAHRDLTKEMRGEIVEFLEKVEQSGEWPQQACTTMFFLIPENVTSERPIALMPTLILWWDALRAPVVVKWQLKYRVDWDATDGRQWRSPSRRCGKF